MPSKLTSQAEHSAEAPGGRAQPSAQDTALHHLSLKARLRPPQSCRQGDGMDLPLLSDPCIPPAESSTSLRFEIQDPRMSSLHSCAFFQVRQQTTHLLSKPRCTVPSAENPRPLSSTRGSPEGPGSLHKQDLLPAALPDWQRRVGAPRLYSRCPPPKRVLALGIRAAWCQVRLSHSTVGNLRAHVSSALLFFTEPQHLKGCLPCRHL